MGRNVPEASNWITVSESQFPWEREALDFVRERFPNYEPYRAWSNFEFVADDGSINEVDLLVFSKVGFFLIEIKSKPGRLFGDPGTWTWETDGKLSSMDNPYGAANLKAKRLRSLLERQRAAKQKYKVPFIDAIVFCSDANLKCELTGNARAHVVLRDREATDDRNARDGIIAAIKERKCPGLYSDLRGDFNKPTSKMILQALQQAGIRPSQRHRKVGDYQLDEVLAEGPGYQDWSAEHVQLKNSRRRIRIYNVRANASPEERETLQRAAKREAELLEGLQHPGILRRDGYTMHELGPALIFEHNPESIRLDHYIAQNHAKLTDEDRCSLLREIAEVISFAHERQTYHRGLSPQSILVDVGNPLSKVKIFNWQFGFRESSDEARHSLGVTATSHLDRLIDESSMAYMAPEATTSDYVSGEKLDVFSLGAIAYFLFTSEPPAANGIELGEKLRDTDGLEISGVRPVGQQLQEMIQWSTNPVIASRVVESVGEFLDQLSAVEKEIRVSEQSFVEDPSVAKTGDLISGDYKIVKRIGHGATSYAFLVEKGGDYFVAKIASDTQYNQRLHEEGEVLAKLRHANIAELTDTITVGDRNALLIRPAIANKEKLTIETLRHRLKEDGALHIDLLQRFGDDLLDAVSFLEEQGYNHRDIKPDNIAVGQVGRGDRLHLVLFDFSLTRVNADNLLAGTPRYLDPMLPLRQNKQWDAYAERYAAAVTLYQMATGPNNFPVWSADGTDATQLDSEAEIDPELFNANLRDHLIEFFEKAFAREISQRHDNAEQMRRHWDDCFRDIEEPGEFSDQFDEHELLATLKSATLETRVSDLGLGARAINALDRNQIVDVEQLLSVSLGTFQRLKGIGHTTRRHIIRVVRILRKNLEQPVPSAAAEESATEDSVNTERISVDQLFSRVASVGHAQGDEARAILPIMLCVDPNADLYWPGSAELAAHTGADRPQVHQWMVAFRARWEKDPAITRIRTDIVELLDSAGQVMTVPEFASALLVARGCHQVEPYRSKYAMAVARAAVEVERVKAEPRFLLRRVDDKLVLATNNEMASLAFELGKVADEMAGEELLVSPARALKRLRSIDEKRTLSLSDSRLARLAVSVSSAAALSSLNEFYPRNMSASRAIKLSQNVLYGADQLTVNQLRQRVRSRYPECEPIPDPPELDRLLEEAGFDYKWNSSTSSYENPQHDQYVFSSGSASFSRFPTTTNAIAAGEVTPEIAEARQFEQRLEYSQKSGTFMVLNVDPRYYQIAIESISQRCDVELFDFEGKFLDTLRVEAESAEVPWQQVLEVDSNPGEGLWDSFLILIDRVMSSIKQQILATEKTVLLVYPGLLSRYNKSSFLGNLEEHIGRELFGLWILLPGSGNILGDDHIPTITASASATVPRSWLENRHRGKERTAVNEVSPAESNP